MTRTSKAFRIGQRVEKRHGLHDRGTILALETSGAGECCVRVKFDAGYTQRNLAGHVQRIKRGPKKKEAIQFCPPGKSGNPKLKLMKPRHQRRRSPFLQGGLPDTNRRRH